MRGVLGIAGTLFGSCFGTCCASMACSACGMACKGSAQGARIGYLILLTLGVVLSLVLRFQLAGALLELKGKGIKMVEECETASCAGNEAVYRVSGAMCAFFLALAAICALPGGIGASLHRGYWAVKMFALSTLVMATPWVPNEAFDVFASVSRVASVLFVLYQGLLLIDFAYGWNAKWVALDEEADAFQWRAAILAICLALYACCFTAIGFMYSLYTAAGCGFSSAVVTVTLLSVLAFTLVGVSPLSPHGALLPSAVIAADCVYLCYSALASTPLEACNPFAASHGGGQETLHLVVGLLMAGVSIAWKANTAASALTADQPVRRAPRRPRREPFPREGSARARAPLRLAAPDAPGVRPPWHAGAWATHAPLPAVPPPVAARRSQASTLLPLSAADTAPSELEAAAEADGADEDASAPLESDAAVFHVMMAVACMYFGTLLTDWGTASPEHGSISQYDVGWASAWLKVGTQWSIILMYTWTLIAPYVFPDREFA